MIAQRKDGGLPLNFEKSQSNPNELGGTPPPLNTGGGMAPPPGPGAPMMPPQ